MFIQLLDHKDKLYICKYTFLWKNEKQHKDAWTCWS
jgi:hypothetical protein